MSGGLQQLAESGGVDEVGPAREHLVDQHLVGLRVGVGYAVGQDVDAVVAAGGVVRAYIEYRASKDGRASRSRAVTGGVLSLLGATAAIAQLIFLALHPDLPVQE
ncbi:hypothetical protein [Streptomyces sp. NPDC002573]|uniref:hypothetical protein n=1 Tax=Streptomyces sp. NPDC002573 TaxID=3364651 RepID=UPI0036D0A396